MYSILINAIFVCLFFLCPFQAISQATLGLIQISDRVSDGYVLFSNNETTYLIDNCGLIVNSWQSAFKPGQCVYLLENGNLLRTAQIDNDFKAVGGSGGRFELFNWEGELIWQAEYIAGNTVTHHDIAPLPNGNFLALVWERKWESLAQEQGRIYEGDVWNEKIIEFNMLPNNELDIVWQWSVWENLVQDVDEQKPNFGNIENQPNKININYIGEGFENSEDWIHLNAIDYNAENEKIVVSSRNFSEIWIINKANGILENRFGNPQAYQSSSAISQTLFQPHDARWTVNQNADNAILVFNNKYLDNQSAVFQFNLDNSNDIGENIYTTTELYSPFMSSAQHLNNGHLFITEGSTGHFTEIDEQQEIVWEYINPINRNGGPGIQGGEARFNETFRATKYEADYMAFNNKQLIGTLPIELNPIESDCFKLESNTAETPFITVLSNPFQNTLLFESMGDLTNNQLYIYNNAGTIQFQSELPLSNSEIYTSNWAYGIYYFIVLIDDEIFYSEKILKR